jgi:hypothetical protein
MHALSHTRKTKSKSSAKSHNGNNLKTERVKWEANKKNGYTLESRFFRRQFRFRSPSVSGQRQTPRKKN